MDFLKQRIVNSLLCISMLFFSLHCINAHAALFNIVPLAGTPLPTTLTSIPTKAYYTVTNRSATSRSGIFVKYLPPNVSQDIVDPIPNLCSANFTLATGESCTLSLNITGPVNAADPNPRNHLFVCLPGCLSCCTGTTFPLNVQSQVQPPTPPVPPIQLLSITISAQSSTIPMGSQLTFTVTALYSDGSTRDVTAESSYASSNPTVATVDNTGVATGVDLGSYTITASFGSFQATTTPLFVRAQLAYITSLGNSTITECLVDPMTGDFNFCSETDLNSTLNLPEAITLNTNLSIAYISQNDTISILKCQVATNGSIFACVDSDFRQSSFPQGITINKRQTKLYVSNFSDMLSTCSINQTTGQLFDCVDITVPNAAGLTGIQLSADGRYAYASDYINSNVQSSVVRCEVDSVNGNLNNCINSGVPPSVIGASDGLGVNGQYLYVGEATNDEVSKCTLDSQTGFTLPGTCAPTGPAQGSGVFVRAQNISFTTNGQFAYVPSRTNNSIIRCAINPSNGEFNTCVTILSGLDEPTSIYIK